MSLFSSLSTAVSGMNAQSEALNAISDNVANSQTVGYKRVDTRFESMVSDIGRRNIAGGVLAHADATNDVQGGIDQVDNPLAMALSGRGFFSVARTIARASDGARVFDPQQMVSRAGDFSLDRDGYFVNGSGDVLQGWALGPDGKVNTSSLAPLRADRSPLAPQPTGALSLAANLPANGAASATGSTDVQVYDALGNLQTLNLAWARGSAADTWTLNVTQAGGASLGSFVVAFGTNGAPAGTIGSVTTSAGAVIGTYSAAAPATARIDLSATFNGAAQPVSLSFGDFGGTNGLTQFSGSTYELRSVDRDGAPQGAFASAAIRADGTIIANYDNGRSRTIGRVPVVTFADADALERLGGQAFAVTELAGTPRINAAGASGAGVIETGAIERSNVDIAAEFSRMIIAQRAYTANTRVVTTSDDMLQETINLKR
ncbi:MAG: flagellar hook protein FlgE [Acetobacteraceae bacterium]|nr:flagellar hook protein FlgE [Acetobacteraceae bacterium]